MARVVFDSPLGFRVIVDPALQTVIVTGVWRIP
jgi:hypothetical protein